MSPSVSRHVTRRPVIGVLTLGIAIAVSLIGLAGVAGAQETPRSGGELVFVVPAEPPSFDAHREESFSLIHPAAPHYSTLLRVAVWLIDQWRQIGLNVKVQTLELATLYDETRGGNFDVAADFHCSYVVEPDLALFKFQSSDVSHVNYSRYVDRTLDELYQRQSRATDREERRRAIREFEKRLLDEEVHYIVPHNARLRGWTVTPSHFLNNQLDTVWLAPE